MTQLHRFTAATLGPKGRGRRGPGAGAEGDGRGPKGTGPKGGPKGTGRRGRAEGDSQNQPVHKVAEFARQVRPVGE
jgi:hypothetical protein